MSDDARQLIDNPYRASHTPIIAGDVNVTDLMARAWDRGFAAGDERLRAMLGKVPREQLGRIMQEVAATPNAPKADVRRWTPAYGPNGSCCYENENGDYVLARDYDDLAAASPDERLREAGPLPPDVIRLCVETHHPIDPGNYEGPIHCTACPEGTPCVTALYVRLEEVNDLRDQVQMYEEKAERDWRDFGEMQDARIAADDRVRELEAQIAACPEDSVSYRVRDRDSDYKAMCHADRDHAELLLKAWLSDGRDAVIESRIVYDAGWSQDVDLAERAARAHRAVSAGSDGEDRPENPEPETNT